jgi:hypothetical protein
MLDPQEMARTHCCEMMTFQVRRLGQCTKGCTGAHDCPDCLVTCATDDSYGLLIHDGGASFVQIAYCPWCGTQLPGGDWVMSLPDGSMPPEAVEGGGDPGRRIDLG